MLLYCDTLPSDTRETYILLTLRAASKRLTKNWFSNVGENLLWYSGYPSLRSKEPWSSLAWLPWLVQNEYQNQNPFLGNPIHQRWIFSLKTSKLIYVINTMSSFFLTEWKRYLKAIHWRHRHHRRMKSTLFRFLSFGLDFWWCSTSQQVNNMR